MQHIPRAVKIHELMKVFLLSSGTLLFDVAIATPLDALLRLYYPRVLITEVRHREASSLNERLRNLFDRMGKLRWSHWHSKKSQDLMPSSRSSFINLHQSLLGIHSLFAYGLPTFLPAFLPTPPNPRYCGYCWTCGSLPLSIESYYGLNYSILYTFSTFRNLLTSHHWHPTIIILLFIPLSQRVEELPLGMHRYLYPVESNPEMLRLYELALCRLSHERSPVLYKIAVHHLSSHLFAPHPHSLRWERVLLLQRLVEEAPQVLSFLFY